MLPAGWQSALVLARSSFLAPETSPAGMDFPHRTATGSSGAQQEVLAIIIRVEPPTPLTTPVTPTHAMT